MNKQDELNKKLAEWAGFKLVSGVPVPYYQNPNRQSVTRSGDMPQFTQSLDACFEWLVPKLNTSYSLTFYRYLDGWVAEIHGNLMTLAIADNFDDRAETTALALCKAIEKLIDGDKAK